MTEDIRVERSGAILVLRIDRPQVANAVDAATAHAIDAILTEAETDAAVGAVVITGTGERAFCSGMDMKEAAALGVGRGLVPGRGFCGITERDFGKPLIAAVNGAAVAGGLEIVLACDLVVASEHAVFGLPEVKRGLVAWSGGVQRLARNLPRAAAMDIIMTGAPVPAKRLHELGVVSRVVPHARLMEETVGLARSILANSWPALRLAKRLFDLSLDVPLREAFEAGHRFGADILAGAESREGVRAYAEHREAEFGDGRAEPGRE